MKKNLLVLLLLSAVSAACMISCVNSNNSTGNAGSTGPAGAPGDTVLFFQDGISPYSTYAGNLAEYISSGDPSLTTGGCQYIYMGVDNITGYQSMRTLMGFDLSAIVPTNVTVTRAYLTLTVYQIVGNGATITAYPLTNGWAEGTICLAYQAGSASWTNNSSGTWSTPGGDFSFSSPESDTVYAGPALASGDTITFTLNASMVNSWITNSFTNSGIILVAQNELYGTNWATFYHNYSVSTNPKLTVYYH